MNMIDYIINIINKFLDYFCLIFKIWKINIYIWGLSFM